MAERKGFEDYMNIINGAHSKTAGIKSGMNPNLLQKLAQELEQEMTPEETAAADASLAAAAQAAGAPATGAAPAIATPAAPLQEGAVIPAAGSVGGANVAVTSATDAVAVPQELLAGAAPTEKIEGEIPAQTIGNEGVLISPADGTIIDANMFGKTDEAAASAAEETSKTSALIKAAAAKKGVVPPQFKKHIASQQAKSEETKQAEDMGRAMARAYVSELEKIALDNEAMEAVEILKEAGLLDGYNLNAGMVKTASSNVSYLEKLASRQPMNKSELVKAASEYIELEKAAAEAEDFGRAQARECFAEEFEKSAAEADETGRQAARQYFDEIQKEAGNDVAKAVEILQSKGILG